MSVELPGKTIYVSFGRFQPPTKGHLDNFNGLSRAAGNNDYRIYLSQTQDSKGDNPLAPESKKGYIKKMMSKYQHKKYRLFITFFMTKLTNGFNKIRFSIF